MEPLLTPNPQRFVLYPIQHRDIWQLYKESLAQFWSAEDIDFSQDAKDWQTLTPEEQHFMKMILAFFAAADGLVMENINQNFALEIQIPEARAFYAFQNFMESVHSETYSLMIDTVLTDPTEKLQLFHALSEFPCVRKLTDWALKWMDAKTHPFAIRLLAFVLYEGLIFQGKFAAIFWMKRRNKLPGICHANLLISRDEAGHEKFGMLLGSKLQHPVPRDTVRAMVEEAVNIEVEFLTSALPVGLIGMNEELMSDYIKLVADHLLEQLGCPRIYQVAPNLISDMMDTIGMPNKVSFFEHRNHVYQRASVMPATQAEGHRTFARDAEF